MHVGWGRVCVSDTIPHSVLRRSCFCGNNIRPCGGGHCGKHGGQERTVCKIGSERTKVHDLCMERLRLCSMYNSAVDCVYTQCVCLYMHLHPNPHSHIPHSSSWRYTSNINNRNSSSRDLEYQQTMIIVIPWMLWYLPHNASYYCNHFENIRVWFMWTISMIHVDTQYDSCGHSSFFRGIIVPLTGAVCTLYCTSKH